MNVILRPVFAFALAAVFVGCNNDVFEGDDGGDAAPADGSADGPSSDGPSSDAVADASDGGPEIFSCASTQPGTILCDDFESSSSPSQKFVGSFAYGGGAIDFDTTHYVSPTHAVTFSVPSTASTLAFSYVLSEATNVTTPSVSVRASLRIHQMDPAQSVPVVRATYTAGGARVSFDIVATNGALALAVSSPSADGGVSVTSWPLVAVALDEWVTVRLDVTTLSPTQATTTVFLDGKQALSTQVPVPKPSDTIRDANIGIVYLTGSALGASVDFDDFLFRSF